MQLSLHADYACRVLIYLATSSSEKSSIEAVASSFGISQNHLVKVVHRLGQLGFLETSRGRGGGISLARPANKISIGDVVRQMEARLDLVECFDMPQNTCPIAGACGLKPWLAKAMAAFFETLDGVTLADVVTKRTKLTSALGMDHAQN